MRIPAWILNPVLRVAVKAPLRVVRDPATLRARLERSARRFFRMPAGTRTHEEAIPRPDGTQMPALWASAPAADRRRVILYLHGGAYLAGSPATHRHLAATLAREAGARALLPDYRLAPEHPFPAAIEDALAAYAALLERGYEARNIAFAGDSAGGGLAAALLLRAEAAGLPVPAAMALFSPWTDLTQTAPSLRRNAARDAMLPVVRMPEVVRHYTGGHPPSDPLISPARGKFRSPPPAIIFASRSEILVDDARMLAEALRAGGGDVSLEIWPRMPHAWPVFVGQLAPADRAVALAGAYLGRRFAGAAD